MSHLSEIETFVLLSELGSFSAVARKLGISTAAVSKQVKRLESRAEVQLLLRSTRRVELTELGRAYLEQCRRIMEEVEASEALLSQMKVSPSGPLHIFSPHHFSKKVILPNLSEFLHLYPKIEIDLSIGERVPHLEQEKIDIFIGSSLSAQGDSIQKKITTTSYTICASPLYLEKFGTPMSLEDLAEHRCIAHSGRRPCDSFYGPLGKEVKFKPYVRVNDADSLARLALEGLGIVQLHHYVVEDFIHEGRLVPLLVSYTRKNVPIYYSLPPRRYVPSKVRSFIDYIVNKL